MCDNEDTDCYTDNLIVSVTEVFTSCPQRPMSFKCVLGPKDLSQLTELLPQYGVNFSRFLLKSKSFDLGVEAETHLHLLI